MYSYLANNIIKNQSKSNHTFSRRIYTNQTNLQKVAEGWNCDSDKLPSARWQQESNNQSFWPIQQQLILPPHITSSPGS